MASKKKYNNEEGVWRTIGGRRVFIKTGQSLSSAMRDSGKFKRMKEEKEHYRKTDEHLRRLEEEADKEYDRDFTEARRLGSDKLELEAKEKRKKRLTDLGNARMDVKKDWEARLEGKEYINDYPEAYRHYERDYESTQWINDDKSLRDEFGLSRQDYPDEKDYMPGGKRWNPEWASARESKVSQEGLNKLKHPKGLKTWDSVEQRYNNDSDFRGMLEREHQKTLNSTRKEIGSYFDLENRDEEIGTKDDLYKLINENYYNVDRDDFDKLYSEEEKARYTKVDKEWQDLSKKMEDYHKEYGTTNWRDEARLNQLSRERDSLSIYNDESKYLKARNEEIRYERALGEYKGGKDEGEKIKKTGNDYLPKASKITTQGTSNRKEVSDNIQAHILEHYDNPVDFMEQMDAMDWLPTRWRAGEELASGGSYLIYYDEQREFLDSLGINPKGKTFSDDRVFQTYNSLIGRESERLYNRLEKLYEQYKKEHKGSDVSLDDFRKWFK